MSLIGRLIEAGTPADLIEEVAMLIAEQRALEKRRAADRERAQRHRDNVMSRDVTGLDVTQRDDTSLSLPPNENNSNPPAHSHPDVNPRAREADPFPMPGYCPSKQVWSDLKANRKAKRLPCTATAHAKLLRDIEKLSDDDWPPGRILEAIVARGWAAAYDPREKSTHGHPRTDLRPATDASRGERRNRCLDMVIAAETEDDPEAYREPDWQGRPALRAIGQV